MSGEILPAIGDFPAGSRIASYRIEQLIGRGGMAVVYRASDVRLDRQVALKILTPELARDDAFRQRFILESRAAAAVDHPNVIPVFEAGEAEGVLFIAMRYVGGQDVRALVDREGKLPAARTVDIVSQVASALDNAHEHGLIHRDVKPANMLLGTVADGRSPDHVYLSDFGLSKHSLATSSLTGTGQFLGTLDYMSPEQVEGRGVDGRTDLYALACTAFEMLTGEPPFRREQNLAVMWAQISAAPPSIRGWRPELPAEVDAVLAKALAKVPADRQSTCLEFARELRAACTATVVQPAAPARQPTEMVHGIAPAGAPVATPVGSGATPPVQGAALIGERTVTEGIAGVPGPSGYGGPPRGAAPPRAGTGANAPGAGHPGFAMTDHGYGQRGGPGGVSPTAQLPPVSGYPAPGRPARRRSKALPVLFILVVIIGLVAATLLVLHLRNHNASSPPQHGKTVTITQTPTHGTSSSSSPSHSQTPPPLSTPQQVVTAFYADINDHHYRQAYELNQTSAVQSTAFAAWKHGYVTTTQNVAVTFGSTTGNVVSVNLTALQTNGVYKYYQGTYTVQNGAIVAAAIQCVVQGNSTCP